MNAVLSWDATPEALEALSVLQFSAPALAFPEANRSPPTEAIASVEHPLLPAGSDQHTLEAAQGAPQPRACLPLPYISSPCAAAISARLQSAAQAVDLVAAELSEVIQVRLHEQHIVSASQLPRSCCKTPRRKRMPCCSATEVLKSLP